MANNFCAACGGALTPEAKFCPFCGKTVMRQPPAAQPVPPVPVAPPFPFPPAAEPPAEPPAAPLPPEVPAAPPAFTENHVQAAVPPPPVYRDVASYSPQPDIPPQPLKPLKYEVFGSNFPAVSIKLDSGDSIYTQSGGLAWMDAGIEMTTNMRGGVLKSLGRMITGESLFMATYTSTLPEREIVIASSFPGSILDLDITGANIIAQKSAFLCAQTSVTLSLYATRSIGAGFFGGEGFLMQKLSGFGKVFLEIDGSLVIRDLSPGETIKVDTGSVAAFEESVNYKAEMVKGFKNILFGGEGLFLTTLTGPGRVWLQTMTMPGFAKQIIPYLPKPGAN